MGRTNTKSIFDPETITTISIGGLGEVKPNHLNQRKAHCAQCSAELLEGTGFQFRAERFGRLHSGYLCKTCIGGILKGIQDWFFNKHFEILQPMIFDAPRSISGETLAEIWVRGGIESLFKRVTTPLSAITPTSPQIGKHDLGGEGQE